MTLPKSAQKRPYLQHGHVAMTKALKAVGNLRQESKARGVGTGFRQGAALKKNHLSN
jgi:hypothetical protein